jgi:hypothetical protein
VEEERGLQDGEEGRGARVVVQISDGRGAADDDEGTRVHVKWLLGGMACMPNCRTNAD